MAVHTERCRSTHPQRLAAAVAPGRSARHNGPVTWQIRDHAGLTSVTGILHRAYTSAIAVFPDGVQHQDDPMTGDHDAV